MTSLGNPTTVATRGRRAERGYLPSSRWGFPPAVGAGPLGMDEHARIGAGMPGASSFLPKGAAVAAVPDVMLNNGRMIPQFGFGVFQIKPKDTAAAVATALGDGYQQIDTAEKYGK